MALFSELLSNRIDITSEMQEKVNKTYENISDTLRKNLKNYDPDIFIQGSFKLKTVVKPVLKAEDYDLDIVCHLKIAKEEILQDDLKKLVGEALCKDYSPELLEPKNRCWCIHQNGFHVDILPAIPETDLSVYDGISETELINSPILIPDKHSQTWVSSNPKGFALWFEKQARQENIKLVTPIAEDSQERLKNPNIGVSILQNAIKIMKYHRDIQFKNDLDNKPISMILTTLAATYYQGEQTIEEALSAIINGTIENSPKIFTECIIANPALPSENFADKWKEKPERREAFKKWVSSLGALLSDCRTYANDTTKLGRLFRENFEYDRASQYAQNLSKELSAGVLGLGISGNIEANAKGHATKYYGGD